MQQAAYKLLSVEEFLDCCPNDQRHYQLIDGVIVAMAPPGDRHQRIAGTLGGLLFNAVEAKLPGCSVLVQAGIAPQGLRGRDHFESDITVTCEPASDERRGLVELPLLIVEILSPGTDRDDVFVKLPSYRAISSVQEILYVETERVGVTLYGRVGPDWRSIVLDKLEDRLQLVTVGLDVSVSQLYRNISGLSEP
jgi:Uma2 family endonuclease